MNEKLSAMDKIIRAKVQLQTKKPFFSMLTMYLNCKQVDKGVLPVDTMGVDMHGNLYFTEKFVNSISEEECEGVLTHEVLHLVLQHLDRCQGRNLMVFNIANDLKVNDIIVSEGMKLPSCGGQAPIPRNHNFSQRGINILNIDKKLSEEIYDELMKFKKMKGLKGNKPSIFIDINNGRFDNHDYAEGDGNGGKEKKGDGKGGKGKANPLNKQLSSEEVKKLQNKWKKVLAEAATYARQRGLLPAGMDRMIDELLEGRVSWKHKLYKYITNEIVHDYSWMRPSKKYASTGVYMPNVTKENIEMVVHIDTSGSISQEELKEFVSEVVSIGNSFTNLKMNLLFCDAQIHNEYELNHNTVDDILNYKINGGGGTSHHPVVSWIKDNKPRAKIFISLTDGYSDIESEYPKLPENMYKIIVMPSKNHADKEELAKYGEIIIIE